MQKRRVINGRVINRIHFLAHAFSPTTDAIATENLPAFFPALKSIGGKEPAGANLAVVSCGTV
jgi:hypothetical protein